MFAIRECPECHRTCLENVYSGIRDLFFQRGGGKKRRGLIFSAFQKGLIREGLKREEGLNTEITVYIILNLIYLTSSGVMVPGKLEFCPRDVASRDGQPKCPKGLN